MNENSHIKDPIIRRYLGLDEIKWITKNKKRIPIQNDFTKYQKTGRIIYGLEEIWIPQSEYAVVEAAFNSDTSIGKDDIFGEKYVHTDDGGYAYYKGVRDKYRHWHYYYREDLNG